MPGQQLIDRLGISQPNNNPLAQPRFDVSVFDPGLEGTAKRGLNTLADLFFGATPQEQAVSYAMSVVPFGLVARPAAKVAQKVYKAVKSKIPKLSAKARAAHPTLPVEGGWGSIGKRSAKEVEEGTNIIDTRTGEIIGEINPDTGKKTYLVSRTKKKPPARMEVHGRTQYVREGDLPIEGLAASRKAKALDKLNSQRLTRQQYAIKANQKRLEKLQKKAEKNTSLEIYL